MNVVLRAEFIFEFTTKQQWINNAAKWFKPFRNEKVIARAKNGTICHIGEDFSAAEEFELFPIRCYTLVRSAHEFDPRPPVRLEIPNYVLVNSKANNLPFYRYLHIEGGAGKPYNDDKVAGGGEFDYILFYASPEQMEGWIGCRRIWCMELEIPFGEGSTIEEAFEDYKRKPGNLLIS